MTALERSRGRAGVLCRWMAGASILLLTACAAPGTPGASGPAADDAGAGGSPASRPGPNRAVAYGGFASLSGAVPSGPVIVPDCVPHSPSPVAPYGSYEIGAVGSFTGDPVALFPGVTTSAVTGTFCALAKLVPPPADGSHPNARVCTQLTAPQDGITFGDVTTSINYIPGVTSVIARVKVTPYAFSAYVCDDGVPGQIKVDTVIEASAAPQLFGTSCAVGPLRASVSGSFTGPLTNAVSTLTSQPFDVSAVQPVVPPAGDPNAAYCPAGLAAATNDLLGLPRTSSTGLTIRTTTGLYLPPPGT